MNSVLARGDLVIATARTLAKIDHLPKSDNIRRLELDITSGEDAIKAVIAEALKFWGRIDVLVNNAGNGAKGILEESGWVTHVVLRLCRADRLWHHAARRN